MVDDDTIGPCETCMYNLPDDGSVGEDLCTHPSVYDPLEPKCGLGRVDYWTPITLPATEVDTNEC